MPAIFMMLLLSLGLLGKMIFSLTLSMIKKRFSLLRERKFIVATPAFKVRKVLED